MGYGSVTRRMGAGSLCRFSRENYSKFKKGMTMLETEKYSSYLVNKALEMIYKQVGFVLFEDMNFCI